MMRKIKRFLRMFKVHHYIVFTLILGLGVFNATTALYPKIQQGHREKRIAQLFNTWWEETGAAQFIAVGLKADEKTRNEEFVQFHDRYMQQNHTYIVEDRVVEMQKEFREWWEIGGGKESYISEHNIYPNEKIFQHECEKWIKQYTDKHVRYKLAFIPKYEDFERTATSWLLFPSFLSFLIFAAFFGIAYVKVTPRWGIGVTLICFLVTAVLGAMATFGLTNTSFFDHFAGERYMGASIPLAFMLGAMAFGRKKDDVLPMERNIAVVGLILDVLTNIFFNGGIYGAVVASSLAFFGLGAVAGIYMPERKKTEREIKAETLAKRLKEHSIKNTVAAKKQKTRDLIEEGFSEYKASHMDAARQMVSQAMKELLQENPPDFETIQSLTERMLGPNFFIEIPCEQWLEWGNTARSKNLAEPALMLLERGLSGEKDVNIARRTLYNIGEIRILKNLNKEEGIERLNKVIELGDKDILAAQAKKLIERAKT